MVEEKKPKDLPKEASYSVDTVFTKIDDPDKKHFKRSDEKY